MHLTLWYIVFVVRAKPSVSSVNCVQSDFFVVCECSMGLLQSIVMSYVNCSDDG